MQSQQQKTIENHISDLLRKTLPDSLLKHVPAAYYAFNRYRYRFLKRPLIQKETSKAKARRLREGLFDAYFKGHGIDIGYGGDPVVPNCRGWDIEDGDAHYLEGLADESFDFAYSSHVLEHLEKPELALTNWWRVLKPGGFLILYIPDRDLYEKKLTLPSRFSLDHKHYFTLDRDEAPSTTGLVPLIQRLFPQAKIIKASLCTEGYINPGPEIHSLGEYSMEVVVQK